MAHVHSLSAALVEARDALEVRLFLALFLLPVLWFQLRRAANQLFEELTDYAARGSPHPRTRNAQRKQTRNTIAP